MHADINTLKEILNIYGLSADITDVHPYIDNIRDDGSVKIIYSVTLQNGSKYIIKILDDGEDIIKERAIIENQSKFSEHMRKSGILTPRRYLSGEKFVTEYIFNEKPRNVTVEDYCGEEIKTIDNHKAYLIGNLMARMHNISLRDNLAIGCGTLFSAAENNDVDIFDTFCEICENENLNKNTVDEIIRLHDEKLRKIRSVWGKLPKSAVQGDISINNLVYSNDAITVFDYNNAGDIVLVSDLVLEGLLTAYEMEIIENQTASCLKEKEIRKSFFLSFVKGYLSERKLSLLEAETAWDIYTLYNGLWFTKVVYIEDSLHKLVESERYDAANKLLATMLSEMKEENDGRFIK